MVVKADCDSGRMESMLSLHSYTLLNSHSPNNNRNKKKAYTAKVYCINKQE